MKVHFRRGLGRCCLTVFTVLWLLAGPAQADWVEIGHFGVDLQCVPSGSNGLTVTIQNLGESGIEGKLRLLVNNVPPANLANEDGIAGEPGTNTTPYYLIPTAQEEFFERFEKSTVTIQLEGIPLDTTVDLEESLGLAVEVNSAYSTRTMFRKNVSKTPELYSGEVLVEVMPLYVEAQNTQGVKLCRGLDDELAPCDEVAAGLDKEEAKELEPAKVKPLVMRYIQEVEDTDFNPVPDWTGGDGTHKARDIYAAVSYDDGATWKRTNISRTADKSSYTLENGVAYPGNSETPDMVVVGPYVLVTWVDKYCQSGNPWDIAEEDDIFQAMGPQRSVNYMDVHGDEEPSPDLGEVPFSCVWAARGVLNRDEKSPDFGTITWYKAEQISTGRRDAYRNDTAGIHPIYESVDEKKPEPGTGGFAITWQEDPEGLKEGDARGPGAGMSGASANHKTDIWYTFISWDAFDDIDPAYPIEEGKPHALNHMASPVRITDNNVCKDAHPEDVYGYKHDPDITRCEYTYEGGTTKQPELWTELPEDWVCPKCGLGKDTFTYDVIKTKHVRPIYCSWYAGNPRVDRQEKYVDPASPDYADAFYTLNGQWVDAGGSPMGDANTAVSYANGNAYIGGNEVFWTGEPLNGDTGATRANLALVNWNKQTLALVAYEETKGEGEGQDKVASAPEQKSPVPVNILEKDSEGNFLTWQGPFKNEDCVSCHYYHTVPRERTIPPTNETACTANGGRWFPPDEEAGITGIEAYWPYMPYPLPDGAAPVVAEGQSPSRCVKFSDGYKICPRDSGETDCNYLALPTHLSGWHRETQDCISCHLPYNTKDLDRDNVKDRFYDRCLDTPLGVSVVMDPASPYYGCSQEQIADFDSALTEEDKKIRHGKDIYYHHFPFNNPQTISQGFKINLPNSKGNYENARRVGIATQTIYDPERPLSEQVTFGLLYKQGLNGQGAPADAFLRLFKGGFDPANLVDGDLNLSGSTILAYKPLALPFLDEAGEPTEENTGVPNPEYDVDVKGHKSPKVEAYAWTGWELGDDSGWKLDEDGNGELDIDANGYPVVKDNPYENVFSTRLSIRGDFIVAGFAHSANWSAARKAHDHYDFYVRTSEDGGRTWTTPVNVSKLKNHKETVSDCRVLQPPPSIPPTIDENTWEQLAYATASGALPPGIFKQMHSEDFYNGNTFLVAIGTEVNIPQPQNEEEDDHTLDEVFADVFYSRTKDRGKSFEAVRKENPKYVEGSAPYMDHYGKPTWDRETVYTTSDGDITLPNDPNPAFSPYVEVFDWLAKGDGAQGDVQIQSTPNGARLYGVWEQELPILEYEGQKHFQGTDVWIRKITYPDFEVLLQADLNGDGAVTSLDADILIGLFGTTAKSADFHWEADYHQDNKIDKKDLVVWEKLRKDYIDTMSRQQE